MKRWLYLVVAALTVTLLLSCDPGGGGNGGGGTGYTAADLAGDWVLKIQKSGAWVQTDYVTWDAFGVATKYASDTCGPGKVGAAGLKPATFTVTSGGRVTGNNMRFNCVELGLDWYLIQSYDLQFTSATAMTGKINLHTFCDVLAGGCTPMPETWTVTATKTH